ncbi:ABC transporter [Helicobacter aurati]|uniref:ABC transporter n=1 Tax=Helicobacter aurati TaxID=137778 RepID=A0A3D8J151_9HELI|nr:zinc ABC transporter substrate-binding protein [Helicobacter aurati]RDU71252.1 ABC transporter [Helicobacter aurati]
MCRNNTRINLIDKPNLICIWSILLSFVVLNHIAWANTTRVTPIHIATSIATLNFFVQEIAKEKAIATNIIPTNKDSESYEPNFNLMNLIAQSELFIGIGMPFEKIWIPRMQSANKNIQLLLLQERLQQQSMHHLWASLANAKHIAKIITETLCELDTNNKRFYQNNLVELLQKLESTQQTISEIIKQMPNKHFIIYHPFLDKFAHEYGLEELSLEQHGKKYGIADMLALIKKGKELQIKRIFAEHKNKDVQTLAREIGAEIIIIKPIDANYLENLESIFKEISKSYIP